MKHLALTRKTGLSNFRRMAIATWGPPDQPTVYGSQTVQMDAALTLVREGHVQSVLPLFVRAVALALRACPDANAALHRGQSHLRTDITLAVLVEMGRDSLGWKRVERADGLDLGQVEAALAQPAPGTAAHRRSWWARMRGPDPTAVSAQLIDAGAWGLDTAYLPLVPEGGAPIVVSLGPVQKRPCIRDGQVVSGHVAQVHASFDHRFIDGFHASVLARTMREVLEDPARAG